MKNKKSGFTLAETLIVLGLIGVVAVFGIVPLVKDYKKQQTVVGLQKSFSTITQSVKMAEKDYGQMTSWAPPAVDYDNVESEKWFSAYSLASYLSVEKVCVGNVRSEVASCWASEAKFLDGKLIGYSAKMPCFLLRDGSSMYFCFVTSLGAFILVDINGPNKGPNIDGKDIFRIVIRYPKGIVEFYGRGGNKNGILTGDFGGCNTVSGQQKGDYCGALIQLEGWQISKEYPWD